LPTLNQSQKKRIQFTISEIFDQFYHEGTIIFVGLIDSPLILWVMTVIPPAIFTPPSLPHRPAILSGLSCHLYQTVR
jgi:hypothetical protein